MIGEYDSGYETCIDTMVRQMEGMQYRIDLMAHDNAALRAKNEKMRELVRDMLIAAEIGNVQIHAKDGDWRTIKERAYDALGIEVDE